MPCAANSRTKFCASRGNGAARWTLNTAGFNNLVRVKKKKQQPYLVRALTITSLILGQIIEVIRLLKK